MNLLKKKCLLKKIGRSNNKMGVKEGAYPPRNELLPAKKGRLPAAKWALIRHIQRHKNGAKKQPEITAKRVSQKF